MTEAAWGGALGSPMGTEAQATYLPLTDPLTGS